MVVKKGQGKNKKDKSNKREQTKDEAWKKVPPKQSDPKTKQHGKYTFNWCVNHMAWTVHKPSECKLGKQRAEEQKSTPQAHSAIVAASPATTVSPHFTALLATLSVEDDK